MGPTNHLDLLRNTFASLGLSSLALAVFLLLICPVAVFIYNIFLHPLRRFPGPLLARGTIFPNIVHLLSGDNHLWVLSLHKQYGPVVRFAPYAISFTDGRAWKDIYGIRKGGQLPFDKEVRTYADNPNGVPSLLTANYEVHAYTRRIFAPAFSERALREQEGIFKKHIDVLVNKLRQSAGKSSEAVDMIRWLHFTTFDIMADLTFGESLGMLDNSAYIPWVSTIFASMKLATIAGALQELPGVRQMFPFLIPKSLIAKREAHFQFSAQRLTRRLGTKTTRPDIWTMVLRNADAGRALTEKEMHSNAGLFMAAGSETTATGLAGLLYFLCENPDKMTKLIGEIRSRYTSENEISMESLAGLKYLNACIAEGLRLYPPLAVGLPRIVPKGGAEIAGFWVPSGYVVSIHLYSANYSPDNFRDPESFIPERWLDELSFDGDKRNSCQPFSYGPRNCLGQNMAYSEMRLVLCKLLWNFNFALTPESANWINQKIYIFWQKPPLMVKLTPAKTD